VEINETEVWDRFWPNSELVTSRIQADLNSAFR
jgi:hypothetical protein